MTYTTQQLQAMSDFEVNKTLAKMLHPEKEVVRSFNDSDEISIVGGGFAKIMINYCNNPNDIMPLAFERRLSLIDCVNEYVCTNDAYGYHKSSSEDFNTNGGFRYVHANPLRAIACLLLMMED